MRGFGASSHPAGSAVRRTSGETTFDIVAKRRKRRPCRSNAECSESDLMLCKTCLWPPDGTGKPGLRHGWDGSKSAGEIAYSHF